MAPSTFFALVAAYLGYRCLTSDENGTTRGIGVLLVWAALIIWTL